jgi:hypothetical protein
MVVSSAPSDVRQTRTWLSNPPPTSVPEPMKATGFTPGAARVRGSPPMLTRHSRTVSSALADATVWLSPANATP